MKSEVASMPARPTAPRGHHPHHVPVLSSPTTVRDGIDVKATAFDVSELFAILTSPTIETVILIEYAEPATVVKGVE